MEKYRIKYGIKLGEWGGNNMLGNKADKEKSKVKELVVNKKMQKDFATQKKLNQTQTISRSPPSLNQKHDSSFIK